MRAERLTIAPDNGARKTVESLALDPRSGVAGDYRSARDGSVSLLSGEAAEEIASLGGLCTGRFMANIITRGLDYAVLETGVRLTIGACELEIDRVGKPCYEICTLVKNGERCPLPVNCAFARIIRGGNIYSNDEIVFASNSGGYT